MKRNKVKRVLLTLVLFFIALLFFSYWYMVKCEGNGYGKPLEKEMKVELSEIRDGMEGVPWPHSQTLWLKYDTVWSPYHRGIRLPLGNFNHSLRLL